MNKSKVKCLSFHELLNIVSFEEVFEYMKGTYHCRGEVDKYRAIFEGYKRLQPIPSDREIKTLFNSSEESEHRKKTPWTEAYMRSKSSEYTPLNWYTFSEDISGMTPDEVLGLKVMDDGEDSYAYLVGTMLWELNRDLHLTSGNADDMSIAKSEIEQGQYIEWPAKDALVVGEDEEMPFLLRDFPAKGNVVTNKTQNILYDNDSKRLITNEWYEQIEYTLHPDIYFVYKSGVDKSGNPCTLCNLLNVSTGELEFETWANDAMWLEHLKLFGIMRDGHWNAYDIEQKIFVLKEDYDAIQRMHISTCLSVKKAGKWNVVYIPIGEYCLDEWCDFTYAVRETMFIVRRDNLYNVYDTDKKKYLFPQWEEMIWPTDEIDFYVVNRDGLLNICNVEDGDDKYIVGLEDIERSNVFDVYIHCCPEKIYQSESSTTFPSSEHFEESVS